MNTIAPVFEDAEKGSSLWHDAWLRLRKNKLALFGGSVLLFMIVVAMLTPWIAPYSYEAQNLLGWLRKNRTYPSSEAEPPSVSSTREAPSAAA